MSQSYMAVHFEMLGFNFRWFTYVIMPNFCVFQKQNDWVGNRGCFRLEAIDRTRVQISCVQMCSLTMPVTDKSLCVCQDGIFLCVKIAFVIMHSNQIWGIARLKLLEL